MVHIMQAQLIHLLTGWDSPISVSINLFLSPLDGSQKYRKKCKEEEKEKGKRKKDGKKKKDTKIQQRLSCQENNGEKLLISQKNYCNENGKLVLNEFSSQSSDLNHVILLGCQNLVFLKACISMFSGKSIYQQVSFNFILSSTSNKD
ncbi:hypothetical protein llap_9223 [Limosa lapponica baueri]|uniref:Uncharacterized protein n=1 Tax=Limosa lapponica baueri TaxID=1758121 RepID=A0A2I0U364_LIMLA|nr:hypothetical protein llap_9223 [Limosa lapponica baueri]